MKAYAYAETYYLQNVNQTRITYYKLDYSMFTTIKIGIASETTTNPNKFTELITCAHEKGIKVVTSKLPMHKNSIEYKIINQETKPEAIKVYRMPLTEVA